MTTEATPDPIATHQALDEAHERLRPTGPEFDGGLSNHSPMATEALRALEMIDAG